MKLVKLIKYSGQIIVKTGLHIGGPKNNLSIGGIDNEVIKLPDGTPYIPGSSLKGKLRYLLELAEGEINSEEPHTCVDATPCNICKLFGSSKHGMGRLIFRDCFLDKDKFKKEFNHKNLDTDYTISKTENWVKRKSGKAGSPREIERVPRGAVFNFEVIMKILDVDDEKELQKSFKKALKLLQKDYLGGNGSRGYGQVEIEYECKCVYPEDDSESEGC